MWARLLIQNWKSIFAVALIAAATIAGYRHGADSVQQEWDAEKSRIAQELLVVALENQSAIAKFQGEKHVDTETIDKLLGDVDAYRVRLQKATRPGVVPSNPATSGSALQTCASGELLAEAEAILGRDRQRAAGIMGEAEYDLADRAVVVKWADTLTQKNTGE